LKQQGHYHDLESTAYSKDGQLLATGGSDGKIKLWNYDTGYCFVTFSDHIAPVTGVTFTSRGNVVLSSSLDGSVRAYDLVRYRNFRTLTPPDEEVIGSVQLTCIASDPSGDIICAGAMDPFNIYVWSLRTSKLLDILKGHEGPISSVAFSASRNLLISASWDKTVRVWDVYSSKNSTERFEHNSDVLAVCVNPQGTQICSATLDGQLFFWNIVDGTLEGTIDGSKDIMGGRKQTDARASTNSTWGDHFTTVSYSPDGSIVIAGGNSKFVCMYEVTQRILVKKFEITSNRSLDGVLDKLDSRNMTEAGIPKQLINDDEEEKFNNFEQLLELKRSMPGVQFGDYSSRKHIPKAIQSKQVCFSPSGESWAVASTEGLMIFSQNSEATFDPISLDLEITPDNIELAFKQHEFSKALLMSLRLNEKEYILNILEHCPPSEIPLIIRSVPVNFLYK
jgi:periodic tryptophan protein 2